MSSILIEGSIFLLMTTALGIDFGTSKIAAVITDGAHVLSAASQQTFAQVDSDPVRAEQDVRRILDTVEEVLQSLDRELLQEISTVGLSGQMHGLLLWRDSDSEVSPLITWQDRRAGERDFLKNLRKKTGDSDLQDGYGLVTLAWLAAHDPSLIARFNRASSIMDYFAALICDDRFSRTDPTIAQSFGFFDIFQKNWDWERIRWGEVPEQLVPELAKSRSLRGMTSDSGVARFGIPQKIPVAMPIGDNQASQVAILRNPECEVALNLGTGGQLSVVVGEDSTQIFPIPPGLELRPYPDGRIAAVSASLCGGKVAEWLCETLITWCRELGGGALDSRDVYEKLNTLGLAALEENTLEAESNLMGERHTPQRRGALKNIDLHNFTLGNVAAALCLDVAANLKSMMPESFFEGRTQIVGSGNGIRKLPLMQKAVEQVFGLPVVLREGKEEAACGAALHALETLGLPRS